MNRRIPYQQDLKNKLLSHAKLEGFHWMTITFTMALLVSGIAACGENNSEPEANPTQVILKLGGKDCEFYLGAVDAVLKKLKGAKEVDLSSQKGHAIVKTDGTLKTSQVVDAVDGLSGEDWKCEAVLQN